MTQNTAKYVQKIIFLNTLYVCHFDCKNRGIFLLLIVIIDGGLIFSSSQQIACVVVWYVVTYVTDSFVVFSAVRPSFVEGRIFHKNYINIMTYRFFHVGQLLGQSAN